jgi:hypothetical protein
VTHFGEIPDPEGHLEVVRERLREQAELAEKVGGEEFEERIRHQIVQRADPETAEALLQAVPPDQQWAGLDRYRAQRAERAGER